MDELYNQLLEKSVPLSSTVCILITGILSVAIPILLVVYLKKKYDCNLKALLVGILTWIVFARIIEALFHQLILGSSLGETIMGNMLYYALYGGVAAAIFEETGRLIVMKTALRPCFDNDKNALMYGAGHGGIESVMVLGIAMLSNLVAAMTINTHQLQPIYDALKKVSEEEAITALQAYISLADYPSGLFFLAIVERVFAIALHLALSVLVWMAVKESKMVYYVYALIGHFLADFLSAYLSSLTTNVILAELYVVLVISVLVAAIYFIVTKSKKTESIQ